MIKRLLLVVAGAVGAIEASRWFDRVRDRYRPSAVTGTLLDKVNDRLEASRSGSASRAPSDTRS